MVGTAGAQGTAVVHPDLLNKRPVQLDLESFLKKMKNLDFRCES